MVVSKSGAPQAYLGREYTAQPISAVSEQRTAKVYRKQHRLGPYYIPSDACFLTFTMNIQDLSFDAASDETMRISWRYAGGLCRLEFNCYKTALRTEAR